MVGIVVTFLHELSSSLTLAVDGNSSLEQLGPQPLTDLIVEVEYSSEELNQELTDEMDSSMPDWGRNPSIVVELPPSHLEPVLSRLTLMICSRLAYNCTMVDVVQNIHSL